MTLARDDPIKYVELRKKAHAAQRLLDRKEEINSHEQRDLDRYNAELLLEKGEEYMSRCPRKTFLEKTGFQRSNLDRLGDKYNIDFRNPTLDLWKIIRSLLHLPGDIYFNRRGVGTRGKDSEVEKAIRKEDLRKKIYARKQRERDLVPITVIHEAHERWAARLRELGHQLGKQYGVPAQHALHDALDDCISMIDNVIDDWKKDGFNRSRRAKDDRTGTGRTPPDAAADTLRDGSISTVGTRKRGRPRKADQDSQPT